MSAPVRVARLDELPPGRGKLVLIGSREVAVYNQEGRFFAVAAPGSRIGGAGGLPGHARAAACEPLGLHFDASLPDSPAQTGSADPRLRAAVEGDFVVVYVERAAAD